MLALHSIIYYKLVVTYLTQYLLKVSDIGKHTDRQLS